MNQNEVFSYNEQANTIMDETVANQDYSPICGAACATLAAIGGAMVLAFFGGCKERKLAKKAAKKCWLKK